MCEGYIIFVKLKYCWVSFNGKFNRSNVLVCVIK